MEKILNNLKALTKSNDGIMIIVSIAVLTYIFLGLAKIPTWGRKSLLKIK